MNEKKVIEIIKIKIKEKGYTQDQFAKLVNWQASQASRFLTGKNTNIVMSKLLEICKLLDIKIS